MKNLVTLDDWSQDRIVGVLDLAAALKNDPDNYSDALRRKVLLMIFEKPSLRTRLSFETGMVQLGGHAIHFDMSKLPLSSGKESVHDTVKVAGRYVDLIMARLYKHSMLEEMAENSDVPVINALTDRAHPCQVLADLLTIREKKGSLGGITLAYVGDIAQEDLAPRVIALMPFQVTADLMSCAKPDVIFMNCLPALRGYEQTGEVIDGPLSVVFDQAENRLHLQKAVMIQLLS